MEATHALAAILRDARKSSLLRMRSEFISQPPSQAKRRRDRHCEERSDEAIHSSFCAEIWIASRSLSSGAHSRDPLARNAGETHLRILAARCARGAHECFALKSEGVGNAGCRCTRSLACKM